MSRLCRRFVLKWQTMRWANKLFHATAYSRARTALRLEPCVRPACGPPIRRGTLDFEDPRLRAPDPRHACRFALKLRLQEAVEQTAFQGCVLGIGP